MWQEPQALLLQTPFAIAVTGITKVCFMQLSFHDASFFCDIMKIRARSLIHFRVYHDVVGELSHRADDLM